MSWQVLRSAWSRVLPEIEQICQPYRTYFRQFSTTPSQWDDSSSGSPGSPSHSRAQQPSHDTSSRGTSSRFRGNPYGQQQHQDGGSRHSNSSAPGGGPVLDIRKTNITFRGRGGGTGGQRGSMRGRGGFRGSGRRPPPTQGDRARGRQRGGGGRNASRRDNQDANALLLPPAPTNKELSQADQEEKLEAVAEEAFQKSMTMGERTVFEPNVSLEDLQKYMPHFARGAAGRRATIINNLAQLGTQDPVNAPQELQPRDYARQLDRDGLQFFADLRERQYTEKYLAGQEEYDAKVYAAHKWLHSEDAEDSEVKADAEAAAETEGGAEAKISILDDVEDSIKQVILEKAVEGVYEKPLLGTDAVTRARAMHVRSESYSTANANAFAAKVQSLLARRTVLPKPAQKEGTKPKENKTRENKAGKKGQKAAKAA